MKTLITAFALLFLAVQIYAQTKPVAYSPLQRTITISSNTFLLNQRLPACSEVYYRVTDLSAVQQGDLFTVLYVPITDANTPAPASTVEIELLSGTVSSNTGIPVSSVISDAVNGTTYSSTSCPFTGSVVERSAGNENIGCGIDYYCSGISSSITGLVIRIATTGDENPEGILFNLSIRRTRLTITTLTVSTTLTVTSTVPTGVSYFKPTMYQKHYKVFVGPAGSSITNYADYFTLYNPMTELVFTLTNLKVNNVAAASDQGYWSLNINYNDIAQADASFMLGTSPSQPCEIAQDIDSAFYSTNTKLEVIIPACNMQIGYYFISVGLPDDTTDSFTYDLLVDITDTNDLADYIPTYQTLSSGTPINDVVGDYTTETLEQNVYLINLASSAYKSGQYIFVTVYGVDLGSVEYEVTQGCYGFDSGCGTCAVLASCNVGTPSKDSGLDYCKVKIDPCSISLNDATPLFVTVRGTGSGYDYISYTVLYELMSTTPVDITTFTKTTGTGYVEYKYTGSVAEQDYNHFYLTLSSGSITELYHLTAHLYTNQEQDEVIFAHNVDNLAGSAIDVFNYDDGDSNYYGPFDSCYAFDYSCNTYLKQGYDRNGYDQIGSCNLQLPYCELLSGTTQYFSVYGLNMSPNSYNNYNNYGTYPDGLGYNRKVDYTLVFRLWSAAQSLTLGQVTNQQVIVPSTFDVYTTTLDANQYSHQYMFTLPTAASGSYYDTVRIKVSNVVGPNDIQVFAGCGSPAGPCPCYKYDYTCTASPHANFQFCTIAIPVCECTGPYYLSIMSVGTTKSQTATYFTLTVFADLATSIQTITPSTITSKISSTIVPNEDFANLPLNGISDFYYPLRGVYAAAYGGDLYTVTVSSVPAATSYLQVKVKIVGEPGKSYFQDHYFGVGLSVGDVVPPTNPLIANCTKSCLASYGTFSYCSVEIEPCDYTTGNYYIRLYGIAYLSTTSNSPYGFEFVDRYGQQYTLEVTEVSNAPVAVTLGTSFRDTITQSDYNHYQVTIPSSTSSSSLRFSIYKNSNQYEEALGLFYNPSGLAGYDTCYSYDRQCVLNGNGLTTMCDIVIAPCETAALAGKTVYFSVSTPSTDFYAVGYLNRVYPVVEGDQAVEYTVLAQLISVQTLDLTKGNPITANLLYRHEAYYSFTITSSDISAGKVFNLEVESLETESNYNSVDQLKITISQNAPGTAIDGDCPCGDIVFTNTFRTQTFPCDLLGNTGTYYVNIRALDYGRPDGLYHILDPISYTIRAWYITPIAQTLSLSSTWTNAPHPLNFQEAVTYKISYAAKADTILVVEIADLTNTFNSSISNGLYAYMSVNYPSAAPEFGQRLFEGSDASCNFFTYCDPSNELTESLDPATVMCNFVITPCIQCSSISSYYVSIVPNMIKPEPRIEYRMNYTIRAYTKTISNLNNYSTSPRTNALATGGYSFSIQETVNPTISCESRFTSDPFFNDFYFKLPSITTNQYEILEYTNDASNPSDILFSFNGGVSPDFIFQGCNCDADPGVSCDFTTGCTVGSQSQVTYGVVGYNYCTSNTSTNANSLVFNTEILNDYDYTQSGSTISGAINTNYSATLQEGQFVVYRIPLSSVNYNLLPYGALEFTFSNGDASTRTCFSYSDPLTTGSAVVFPGSSASSSSYCNLCTPAPTSDFVGCCTDPSTIFYVTIYNPFGNNQNMTYTFRANVEYDGFSFTQLTVSTTSTTATTVSSVSPTQPALFSFDLTSAILNEDDVVNMRFRSTNGTAHVYINNLFFAHPTDSCASYYYDCTTDTDACIMQLPYCYFASATSNTAYQSYYIAIVSDEAGVYVGPVQINIWVQKTTSFNIPLSTSLTNSIPDASYVPVDYLQHYKFQFTRTVGDQLLSDNDVALTIKLTPNSSANNTLQISFNDPQTSTTSINPLAGAITSSFATGTCAYNTDTAWECYPISTGTNGTATYTTNGTTDGVICYLTFCNGADMRATVNQLLSNQYIYLSVQNLASTGRVPTGYSISASITSSPLSSSEASYKLVPAHTSTDVIYNSTCTSSSSSTTGGCFFAGSSTITTAYFSIDLSGVGSWAVNDYLLINITNLAGSSISVTSWSSDECEPLSSTVDMTCTVGTDCVVESDPCQFGALFRADNGANSYKVIPRNGYLRISGITTGTTFNVAVLQVSPLQVTTVLTAASPSYTNTFQMWDYRWALFNFVVPKDELHHLEISITSDCTNGANLPEVYVNEYTYQWASKECNEYTSNTPFTWTHYTCDPAGNVFVSVYTPESTLKYDPIAIAEGSYSPQVKFTITATLVTITTVNDYSWECDLAIDSAGTYNVLALGDNENFGTAITISLAAPAADASIKVVTPVFRQAFGLNSYDPIGDFYSTFYSTSDACVEPACTDDGVYCCSSASECVINIPPCEYQNGRYFIIIDAGSTAVLSSHIYRQDYILTQVGNSPITLTGVLPLGPNNGNVFYQYYKLEMVGSPQFLQISAYYTEEQYQEWFFNLFGAAYFYDGLPSTDPVIHASLLRGDTTYQTTGSSCADLSCSSTLECNILENQCVSDVYYLAVWFTPNSLPYCNSFPYSIDILTQVADIITIQPNTVICGTVAQDNFVTINDGYSVAKRDLPPSRTYDIRNNFVYPPMNTYYLDTSSINAFSEIIVRLEAFPVDITDDLYLTVSTSEVPSSLCNSCHAVTDVSVGSTVVSIPLGCGNFTDLWITVQSTESNRVYYTDYTLEVEVTEYSIYTPSIPTLTSGIPSTVSVTASDVNSIINFSTNNGARALVVGDITVYSSPSSAECAGECTTAESGCTYLASASNYYVYTSPSLTAADYCWEDGVTSEAVSLSVQSVNSFTISASSVITYTSVVYGDNYQLITATLPSNPLASTEYTFSFSDVPDGIFLSATVGCTGFTVGTGCVNNELFAFYSRGPITVPYSDFCGCDQLYIAVSAAACGNNGIDFSITVDPTPNVVVTGLTTALTTSWLADTIPTFANGVQAKLYSVQASSAGFVHVAVANVNNTAGTNFHSVEAYMVTSEGCFLTSCVTGQFDHMGTPSRDGNDADQSCYVYASVPANELVYIEVAPNEAPASFPAAGITYRIKSTVSYTDLETTSSQNFQIRGRDRHYYKVNGRPSGSAANDIQSVVIDLQIIDGDRLNIYVADSTSFADSTSYAGWSRVKTCYFGLCTIEIPTRVQHPGANVFYVWVETVSTTTTEDERLEKPTNYKISATTGTNNCKSGNNLVSGFCSSVVSSLSSVYNYRDLDARNNEAECRYENLLCGCTHSLPICQTRLLRFSCLESFRECDASGFWVPLCRYECSIVEAQCGSFAAQYDQCDDCSRPEFDCLSQRYSDDTVCTGAQQPSASPTPSNTPSTSFTSTPSLSNSFSSSISITASASPTPTVGTIDSVTPTTSFTPSPSAAQSPNPAASSGNNIIIIVEESSSSVLIANTLLIVLAFLFFNF